VRHGHGTRLHIGCGKRRLAGWVNADAVPGVGDVVLDLHDELPRAAFYEIYGSHVLEHCWPQDTPAILRRMHDALLPGGTLRLSVPDIRLVVKNCIDGNAYGDERSALSVIYGGSFSRTTTDPDFHRQAFWRERLERLLQEAGFVNVREWGRGQYPAIDALQDYATFPFGSDGKSLISLNMEADRPGELPRASYITAGEAGDVEVSVLLGTVDRPDMLRDCVAALRESLTGLNYEIIVAYGRDDDASLPWMREQKDIVRVCGGMNGAIEAFNLAYRISRGRYICQINDDVLVDGDAVNRAVQHLNAAPTSAGVVFQFDRDDGKGYRHDRIAGRLHPNQMVVRRETCEAVIERIGAFWGDDTHRTDKTYGGDSAFGVVCGHLGLRLDSVPGVTCRDLLAQDALREKNARVVQDHGTRWLGMYGQMMETSDYEPHADAWPHVYVPRPGMAPRRSPIAAGRPLRVLVLPIAIKGWPQTALREAFAKIGPTVEMPRVKNIDRRVIELAAQHKPDLVWAQIQNDQEYEISKALRKAVGPDCTMVQWTGDVRTHAGEPMEQWIGDLADSFDILLSDNCTYPKKLGVQGIKAGYLCHGFESEITWEPNAEETGGAVFIGTNYTTLDGGARERLFRSIDAVMPGLLTLYGHGWRFNMGGPVDISTAGAIMRRAAITISTSLYSNLERYTSNRLKYALAAGAVTAVERFTDMEGLGLVHGKTCLVWSSAEDLIPMLKDWTQPERAHERQAIREAARALAVDRFTWDRSVEELLAIVRDYRARKGLA
jgi:hypothetical protein